MRVVKSNATKSEALTKVQYSSQHAKKGARQRAGGIKLYQEVEGMPVWAEHGPAPIAREPSSTHSSSTASYRYAEALYTGMMTVSWGLSLCMIRPVFLLVSKLPQELNQAHI